MANDNNNDIYTLFFDGCSKGNPGKSGSGAVIYKNGTEIWAKSLFVGEKQTNNYAEYMGLIIGLEEAVKLGILTLSVRGDSLLVIKQVKGEYKVNSPNLLELYKKVCELKKRFMKIDLSHVYRVDNKRADCLANEAVL
jgi:ribonuclease HI